MPVRGYIDSEHYDPPAPFLSGMIYFPRLGTAGLISFLVDTGSDLTYLPRDHAIDLGIDYRALGQNRLFGLRGVSGATGYFRELALVLFRDDTGRELMSQLVVGLQATPGDGSDIDHPPLLGRDFLNRCDLRVNFAQSLVELEPISVEGNFIVEPPA